MSFINLNQLTPEQKSLLKQQFMDKFNKDSVNKKLPFKESSWNEPLLKETINTVFGMKSIESFKDIPSEIKYKRLIIKLAHKQYVFEVIQKLLNKMIKTKIGLIKDFSVDSSDENEEDSSIEITEDTSESDVEEQNKSDESTKETNKQQEQIEQDTTIKQTNSYIEVWFNNINNFDDTTNNSVKKNIPKSEDYIDYLDDFEPIKSTEQIDDPIYQTDLYLENNEITNQFLYQVSKNFKQYNYNIDYIKSFTPKNIRWGCYNFLNNLIDRELPDNFNTQTYLKMIFSVMSGYMPFKKVHINKITEKYNAFTSQLLETKSTCDKNKALTDSLKYNEDNYMLYTKFELCEYIITDYQRFVFDIDVEFKKVKKIHDGDDIIIEHNYNDETKQQLQNELTMIQKMLRQIADDNDLPYPKIYAYVMFGTADSDVYKNDFESKKQWCADIFEGINCIYEYNQRAKKVISVHIGVAGWCYARIQNDGFRRYLNTTKFNNTKFEMVDSSIYNKTQHAWRFAYSRKNNQRCCTLKPYELIQNKEILANLFAYPDEDDIIVKIPDNYMVIDEIKIKQQKELVNNENSIISYYQKLASDKKEVEIIHKLGKKVYEDFFTNQSETTSNNDIFDAQIDPRLIKAINHVKRNNVGYPEIRKAIFCFVNVYRNYYSDQGECIELLLNIDYYHTNGIINNQSSQFIPSLVKYAWKNEIKPISMKYDLSVYKKDTLKVLSGAVWKDIQLKHYLRQMIFKVGDVLYLRSLSTELNRENWIQITFDKLKNYFNTGFWVIRKIKEDDKEGVKIYRVTAEAFIRNMLLTEYSGIEIAHSDSYNFKNLYDKPIGITKSGNKIFNLKEKKYALHDKTPKDRPHQITNILRSILTNNTLDEQQLTERINYFESIFAFKLQNPDIRIDLAPIICSREGIGKNTYFKILKTALDIWVQDDLSWDIARGTFNGNQQLNIIRAYDEVTSTKSSLDLMKRLITAETEDVNVKYEKQSKMRNIALKCFLTNNYNNNILSKTGENRRFLYYLPTTTTQQGQQITKDNWWGLSDEERKKLGKYYFNYLIRLDVSNFDHAVKPNVEYIDDMNEFRESSNISADSTTQFITNIINTLEIPKTNNMLFIPTQLIIDLGNMCKRGISQLDEFEFDFTSLVEWYHNNISSDYTWNQKSIMNRLNENDSIYKPKTIRTVKLIKAITKNKDILMKYLDTQVRGYYM